MLVFGGEERKKEETNGSKVDCGGGGNGIKFCFEMRNLKRHWERYI